MWGGPNLKRSFGYKSGDRCGEVWGSSAIEGISNLELGGEYLIVSGLYFRNGYTPSEDVIAFRIDNKALAPI